MTWLFRGERECEFEPYQKFMLQYFSIFVNTHCFLVLSDGMSTFVVYLMPKPPELKNNGGII